jgi:hypothetical protein
MPESLSAVTSSSGIRVLAELANEVGRRPHEKTGGQRAHKGEAPVGPPDRNSSGRGKSCLWATGVAWQGGKLIPSP